MNYELGKNRIWLFAFIAAFIILYSLFMIPDTVFAQGSVTGDTPPSNDLYTLPNPLKTESIGGLLKRIIDIISRVVAPLIATLMIIVGAFQILTAGGNSEKVQSGKKTILYAIVGLAILLLGDLLISLVVEIIGFKS